MSRIAVVLLLVTACSKAGPSQADCEAAVDHLAQVAESGENQIPKARYKKENAAGLMAACSSWSKARLDCVLAMPDIRAAQWAKCDGQ